MSSAGRAESEWERGISTLSVNSLSVCVWELSLPLESPLSSDRRMTETSWELQHSPSLSLSPSVSLSLFPTRTDRSQIHSNRAYFNTFSVGTWGWLKINNLSIASRSLSFSQYLSFWVCFAVVAAVVVLHCSGGFSSFFFSPLFLPFLYSLEKKECFSGCSQWYGTEQLFQFHYINSFDASSCSLVSMAKWLWERALD